MANNSTLSPNQKALRRLYKNRPAVVGLAIISLAIILAILGYGITPDQTPDTNEQNTEISLAQPGFTSLMLAVRKNKPIEECVWWKAICFGKQSAFDNIAIKNYAFRKDSIIAYTLGGDTLAFSLPDVVFPLSLKNNTIISNRDTLHFFLMDGKEQAASLNDLQTKIKEKHLFQKKFYLGTDKFGRCMLSRLIIGTRISILVGLIAVFISLFIGITMGAMAGYFGGRIDDLITLIMNVIWSIPTVLLVFAIVLALGRGIGNIFFAVGLTMWVDVARMVRGQVLSLRELQYIEATKSFGYSTYRTIFKHILPNILGPVMVIAASNFATAILLEAGLSYLGFGIRPPTPSWGTMLNETYGYAISGKPLLAMIPAFAIMLLVLAFNLLGNGIRDALDVKS